MRGPLIERLPPGAPEMARFDESVAQVDHRRSVNINLAPSSEKRYARLYRRYREFCALRGYQAGPESIDSDKIYEFTIYMTTELRYVPTTVSHGIKAVKMYAERAEQVVGVEAALGVLDSYRLELAERGEPVPPPRRRRVH